MPAMRRASCRNSAPMRGATGRGPPATTIPRPPSGPNRIAPACCRPGPGRRGRAARPLRRRGHRRRGPRPVQPGGARPGHPPRPRPGWAGQGARCLSPGADHGGGTDPARTATGSGPLHPCPLPVLPPAELSGLGGGRVRNQAGIKARRRDGCRAAWRATPSAPASPTAGPHAAPPPSARSRCPTSRYTGRHRPAAARPGRSPPAPGP